MSEKSMAMLFLAFIPISQVMCFCVGYLLGKRKKERVMMLRHDGFRLLSVMLSQAVQTQRELDRHTFKEALKSAGIGGRQYDNIIENIMDAEVKI